MTEAEIQVMREFCARNRILFAPTYDTDRDHPHGYRYQVEGEPRDIGPYETHVSYLGRLLVMPGLEYVRGHYCRSCSHMLWYAYLIVRSPWPPSGIIANAEMWNYRPQVIVGICWYCQPPVWVQSDCRELAKVCGTYRSPQRLFALLLKAFPPPILRLPEARVVCI